MISNTPIIFGTHAAGIVPEPVLINREYMEAVFGAPGILPVESFEHMVDLFDKDNRPLLRNLKRAVDALDWTFVRSLTHSLGGAARSLGAKHIGELCQDLNHAAKAADIPHAKAYMNEIEVWYGPTLEAFRTYARGVRDADSDSSAGVA